NEIKLLLTHPQHRFHFPDAAPTVIQSWWRMVRARRIYLYRSTRNAAATILWRVWRRMHALRLLHERIRARKTSDKEKCVKLGNKLKREWSRTYKGNRRVYIHISSTLASAPAETQISEIGRIMDIHDQNVSVIFITQTVDSAVVARLQHILRLSFAPQDLARLTVTTPQSAHLFLGPTSPANWILTCPITTRTLRDTGERRNCLIVPGSGFGEAEIELSATLNIPLSETPVPPILFPAQLRQLFETAMAEPMLGKSLTNATPSEWSTAYQDLLTENPAIHNWEVAFQDDPRTWEVREEHALRELVSKTTSNSTGVLQARPASGELMAAVCLRIDPDGDVSVIGTCDEALGMAPASRPSCIFYPSSSTSMLAPAIAVATTLYKRHNFYGHMTVEFATPYNSVKDLHPYRVRFGYGDLHAGIQTFEMVAGARFKGRLFENAVTAKMETHELGYTAQVAWVDRVRASKQAKRHKIYPRTAIQIPRLAHPAMQTMSWNSLVAVSEAIFDPQFRVGTTFPRLSTARECASMDMFCIQEDHDKCATLALSAVRALDAALRTRTDQPLKEWEDIAILLCRIVEPNTPATHALRTPPDLSSTVTTPTPAPFTTSTDVALLLTPIPSSHLFANNPSWNRVPTYTPILPTLSFPTPRIAPGLTTFEYLIVMERIMGDMDLARQEQRTWENVTTLRSGLSVSGKGRTSVTDEGKDVMLRAGDFMGANAKQGLRRSSLIPTKEEKKIRNEKAEALKETLEDGATSVIRHVFTNFI
ncbi:hypothetical protein HKX48_008105, partial [Thoreauomyces humboldtii]